MSNRVMLWAALSLIIIVVTVGACGSGGEPYPEQFKENFTTSCVSTGGTMAQCECSLRWFEKNVPLKDFTREDERARSTGVLSDQLAVWSAKASNSCR